ncbi:spore coat U domain-containing protein [Pusillimonas sp. ANT_WB101]|uniref:Csu type fimbrial protein n=1 Tax=Pusillimonas sp. ANT_WB101 TaxID=2597356 RepID=UPI0011EDE17A|nr:spore coat U domain-containing protein [Pusillimonas sp. ANT_WB101]KAA0911468.1 spore coat protein U domain-containing protein [Pusillimonas sp. ANT_WB101]
MTVSYLAQASNALAKMLIAIGMASMPGLACAINFSCNATMSSMTFSDVDLANNVGLTSTATLSYQCKNTGVALTRNARVCFSIGDGSQGAGNYNPRRMIGSSSNVLQFQLFQPDGNTIWGSKNNGVVPAPVEIVLTGVGPGVTRSGVIMMQGRIIQGQAPIAPGNFQNNFSGNNTKISLESATLSVPSSCGVDNDGNFPFQVTAVISKSCNVDASDMNFGVVQHPVLATNVDAQSDIFVNCTPGTPYNIALHPSNNSSTGAGLMSSLGGISGNTDKVPYQLYRDVISTGKQWGSQIGVNTLAGTGTGLNQSYRAYGRVPSTNFAADSYRDVVTVRVNY